MKKAFLFCCLLALLFAQNIYSQQLGDLYSARDGSFTMSMPRGWQTFDVGQPFLSILGPQESDFTPNMGFNDEEFGGTVNQYIDAALPALQSIFPNFSLVSRDSFITEAGLRGECITYLVTVNNIRVRLRQYVFSNNSGTAVIVISCGSPGNDGVRFDALFDASVKTFRWTR